MATLLRPWRRGRAGRPGGGGRDDVCSVVSMDKTHRRQRRQCLVCNVLWSLWEPQTAQHRTRQQASDWSEAIRGGASAPARSARVAVLVVVSQLFISVTDLGGCGLDPSPRMRSRRKRAQRAALRLPITAPQMTSLHSHTKSPVWESCSSCPVSATA